MNRSKSVKWDFHNICYPEDWRTFIREVEIRKIFDGFSGRIFNKCLELGCGSGKNSKHLRLYCKRIIALEYNESKLTEQSDAIITFMLGNAQDLSRFHDCEMDLIFSSNVIEHLPNVSRCLAECRRVVKQGGLIIHTVPNRTWKVFQLLLYYPYVVRKIFTHVFWKDKCPQPNDAHHLKPRLNSNLKPIQETRSSIIRLLPPVHGISSSNITEFLRWGKNRWIYLFERSGLTVVNMVRLPFYFGYGYNFRFLLRLGNRLGLSSCTAFVLKKNEC